MRNVTLSLISVTSIAAMFAGIAITSAATLRPPSVPLVACDPYFSIWSSADKLTDTGTVHWTGKPHRLTSMVYIDKTPLRVMGALPEDVPAMPQKSVTVSATRTQYEFEGSGVGVTLTFMTPALPEDLDVLARPVTYLTYDVRSVDGRPHAIRIQFQASGEIAVNTPDQEVDASSEQIGDLTAIKIGSTDQPILAKKGDDIRIDWGYFYVAVPKAPGACVRRLPPKQQACRRQVNQWLPLLHSIWARSRRNLFRAG